MEQYTPILVATGNAQGLIAQNLAMLPIKSKASNELNHLKPFPAHCAYRIPGSFFPWEFKKIINKNQ